MGTRHNFPFFKTSQLGLETPTRITGAVDNPIVLGTSAAPLTTSTANNKFVEIRATTTATSGDARIIYAALTFDGAGGAGEAVRGRAVLTAAVAGTVNGGHFGVESGTGGSVTGLATGCRATFMCPDRAASGTICGGMSELWAEGASSDFAGATKHSIHRFVMDGNATGKATATTVFEFVGLSNTQFVAATNTVIDHALRIDVAGTTYYIGLYDATS